MRVSAGPFCDPRQLSTIDELLRETPGGLHLRFGRACCLEDLGLTEDAIRAYVDILERDPAHLGALTNLGSLLFERGRAVEARPYVRAAAELHPADPVALVNLARLDAAAGDFDAAIAGYRSVLALKPDSLHARLGLSRVYAQLAELNRDRAYATPRIWHYPYRGSAQPLKALLLASAEGGDIASNLFFDDNVVQKSVLLADSAHAGLNIPAHHVLFNVIGDADRCALSLVRAQAICTASRAPVINEPAAVARTGRVEMMRRLRPLADVRAPLTEAFARDDVTQAALAERGFTFPLLLRSPGHHAGMHLALVEHVEALRDIVATLPGRELLAIEFLDARDARGAVRKYRVIAVDGRLYPLHLAIAPQWKIHYFSAGMAERPDYRAEEAAFLADMPAVIGESALRALEAVSATLGLDYAGVDFGIAADGSVLVFEANATMAVYPPDAEDIWEYRRAAADRIIAAVRSMLIARAKIAGYA